MVNHLFSRKVLLFLKVVRNPSLSSHLYRSSEQNKMLIIRILILLYPSEETLVSGAVLYLYAVNI